MAAQMAQPQAPAQLPRQQPPPLPNFTREHFQKIVGRAQQLRAAGFTPETSPELDKIVKLLNAVHREQAQAQIQRGQLPDGSPTESLPNGHGLSNGSPFPPGAISNNVPVVSPSTPVSFTEDQILTLKHQIAAFKYISRGMAVPPEHQAGLRVTQGANAELQKQLQNQSVDDKLLDSVVKVQQASAAGSPVDGALTANGVVKAEEVDSDADGADLPKGSFLEDNVHSGIYPYNSYVHPFTLLKRTTSGSDPSLQASRLQRLLVPSVMPHGLDPHQIIAERNRYVDARINRRIRELEEMPSTLGEGGLDAGINDENMPEFKLNGVSPAPEKALSALVHPSARAHGKLRAMLELKALRVVDKQRELRALVAEKLAHGTFLPLNRAEFKRTRKPDRRDARTTEQLERKQRVDRERRAKQKHVEQLEVICDHGRQLIAANRAAQDRLTKLGRAVLSFHAHAEKEEQKRIERISKERLKALKADDEEAYMKLIDTAKDTRITHLLKQTDSYLDSLAQAVVAQQLEAGGGTFGADVGEQEDGAANEAMFGAQVADDEEANPDPKKIDYYAVAHRIKEKVSRQPSILVGGQLKEYQLKGLQWMVSLYNNRLNGILADEMGLGKTIQTISLVTFLIEVKRQRGPYLIIVPLSTMTNWSGEFAKWAPSVNMISYKGNPTQRRALQNDIRMGQFQVLLTTYEYIIMDRPILSKIKWVHMVIDEGHRMKNTKSKLALTLAQYYHSRYRLILTGTPLQNNLPELWSLLNFALPKIFNSVKSFDEWFNTPFANSGTGDKIELNEEEALLIIRRLHKVLRPFLLRRLKKDVENELPDKVEKVIKVKMSALQSQLYKQMKKYRMIADGDNAKPGKMAGVKGLSNELMQLRKICQHPFLFESVEDRVNPQGLINESVIRTSGKIELLARILPKFFATDHRVLIFFQMTKVMDIMEDFMKMMNYKYLRLDGGTKTEERAGHVQLFNAPNSEYKVFILSTRAGGLGLNLQTADTVVIFDSDWNPHADLQAQDRAHRIGQKKAVRILRFITEKSVEEAMYARARQKLNIDDKVIQAGRFDNKSTQEEREEFLRSILEADQDEDSEEAGDMNDDEINEIIARSEEETKIFGEMDIQRDREAAESWRAAGNRGRPPPPLISLEELPECYRNDAPFEVSQLEDEMEGRGARKRNIVSYNDGLSDEQWAIALEEGVDMDELVETNRRRLASERTSVVDSPAPEPTPRGRPKGRKNKPKNTEEFELPAGAKRKRGKAMSITPSVNGDEDEAPGNKRRKLKVEEVPAAVREKMKKAFAECHKAVMACEDETGRKRCELFKELPDKRDYPDYYQLIKQPIALSHLRKRAQGNHYKDVNAYRDDFRLMFSNAKTYNQEGSWVYMDAEEMQKVFESTFERIVAGSNLPGAGPAVSAPVSSSGSMAHGMMSRDDDDMRPAPSSRRGSHRRQVVSDEEYLTQSDDE